MNRLHLFQQLRCILVLSKGRKDEDQVLNGICILLIHGLDICHNVLALTVLAKFHETVRLDSVVERILVIFQQS